MMGFDNPVHIFRLFSHHILSSLVATLYEGSKSDACAFGRRFGSQRQFLMA